MGRQPSLSLRLDNPCMLSLSHILPSGGLLARAVLVTLPLMACSPVYDWRELSLEGDLVVWLPCKAQVVSRDVPLLGQRWPMTVRACEAGGQRWAVSQIGGVPAAQREAVQQALDAALAANLAAPLPRAQVPVSSGLASAQGVRSLELRGRRPDGAAMVVSLWSFAFGDQVGQASVMRAADVAPDPAADEARHTFFESLTLRRPG